jgi:hypothetical protein
MEEKWFDIHGSIKIDVDIDTFHKEIMEWFGSKGWSFHGFTKPTLDE